MTPCTITADIKESKKLKKRARIQERLKKSLNEINKKYHSELIAGFMITLGDEFQGVLKTPSCWYDVVLDLQEKLEFDIYYGIGVGSIDTEFSSKSTEMDGPSFHRSREALEEAKRLKRRIVIKTGGDDTIINVILALMEAIKEGWTQRQKEIITFYRRHRGLSYEKIAENYGVTKQAISKILHAAHWNIITEAEDCIRKLSNKNG